MAILPWVNLPQNRTPDLLGSIGDTLIEAARRKQEKERAAADLLLRQRTADREDQELGLRRQNYASEDAARKSEMEMRKAQEQRITSQETRQQGLDVANVIPKLTAMAVNDPAGAESLARAYGIKNWRALQPDAPAMAPVPEVKPSLPGGLDAISGGGPSIDPAEQQRAQGIQASNDQAMAKFKQQLPTYSGDSPIGPVSIDPNSIRRQHDAELAQRQQELSPLASVAGLNPAARSRMQALIQSGAQRPELESALKAEQAQQEKEDTDRTYRMTAESQLAHQREMERIGWAGVNTKRDAGDERKQRDAENQQDKLDTTVVRDENGNPIGHVPSGKGGAQGFASRDADYKRAIEQLEALKADVDQNGSRVILPSSVQRRNTLKQSADIGVATVSPLGKTDEAMKKESASIGGGGALGLNADVLLGAQPEAIQRKIAEIQMQRDRYRRETLIPLRDGEPSDRPAPRSVGSRLIDAANKPKRNPLLEAGKKPAPIDDLLKQAGF